MNTNIKQNPKLQTIAGAILLLAGLTTAFTLGIGPSLVFMAIGAIFTWVTLASANASENLQLSTLLDGLFYIVFLALIWQFIGGLPALACTLVTVGGIVLGIGINGIKGAQMVSAQT